MIKIPTNLLKAVSLAMADKDIRYYLCGAMVELSKDRIVIAATDGHRIHAGTFVAPDGTPTLSFIIPAATIKLALSASTKSEHIELEIMPYKLGSFDFTPEEGLFPDWRRAIVDVTHEGPLPCVNAKYIKFATDAAKLLQPKDQNVRMVSQLNSGQIRLTMPDYPGFIAAIAGYEDRQISTNVWWVP